MLSWIVDRLSEHYNARVLLRKSQEDETRLGRFMYNRTADYVRFSNYVGLGRKTDLTFLQMEPKLRQQTMELHDPAHDRTEIRLTPEEEKILMEAIVSAENLKYVQLLYSTLQVVFEGLSDIFVIAFGHCSCQQSISWSRAP